MAKTKAIPPHVKGARSQLLKVFDKAFHSGYRPVDVFSAMLDGYLMTLYEKNGVDKARALQIVFPDNRHTRLQPLVDEAIERYRGEVAADAPFADLLGPLYMELSSHYKQSGMGQYFTPAPIAKMMAMMTEPERPRDGKLVRACDPACGSGVMMLSALQHVLETQGPEALARWSVTGIDLDPLCAKMFAVQMTENILAKKLELGEVQVLRGNSLGDPAKLQLVLHLTSAHQASQHPANGARRLSVHSEREAVRPAGN